MLKGIGKPLLYLGVIVYCIWHPIWLYFIFIYLSKRQFFWAPLSNVVSIYIHVLSIIIYCIIMKPHQPLSFQYVPFWKVIKWETNWKQDTFIDKNLNKSHINLTVIDKGMKEYVELVIAGIFSVCAEWWSWEIVTFLSGLLGPIQLAAHVIYASMVPLYFMIPLGLGMAAASRIGKCVGENRYHLAKYLAIAILWFTLFETVVLSIISYFIRLYIPSLFTDNKDVIDVAVKLSPLYCLFIIPDAFQGSVQGILRGIKKQGKSVIGVIVGPYLITLPLACLLAFDPNINLKIFGMWIANNIGYFVMDAIFLYLVLTFNWNESKNENQQNQNNELINISMNISHFSGFLSINNIEKNT